MPLTRFVARRTGQALITLLGATLLLWFTVFVLPGDPVRALFGFRQPDAEVLAALRAQYGLDDPLPLQYVRYLGNVLRGDFGDVYRVDVYGQVTAGRGGVTGLIRTGAPVTLRLVGVAVAVQVVAGTLLGVLAGRRRRGVVDRGLTVASGVAAAVPVLVVAFVLHQLLAWELRWFPISGERGGWVAYVLPGATLAVLPSLVVARLARNAVADELRSPHAAVAAGMGIPRRRVVWVHALRRSLVPVVTCSGAEIGALLSGAIVVESVFGLPGLGGAILGAIQGRQGPTLVSVTTLFVVVTVLGSFLVDLAVGALDPRVRASAAS